MLGMTSCAEIESWTTADGAMLRAVRRPDGAWSVRLPDDQPRAWRALVDAATRDGCGTLLLSRPVEQDEEQLIALRRAGFAPARTETI